MLVLAVSGWALLTGLAGLTIKQVFRLASETPVPPGLESWVQAAIDEQAAGRTMPSPPEEVASYRASGPLILEGWREGERVVQHLGSPEPVATLLGASPLLERNGSSLTWTVTVPLAEGPMIQRIPWVSALNLVPIREGLVAHYEGRSSYMTPASLTAAGRYDTGVFIRWIPDLSFGVDLPALTEELAGDLGVTRASLERDGRVRRFLALTLTRSPYPKSEEVTEASIRTAAVDGARFLLRHQRSDGRYTYLYDGRTGKGRPAGYNLPRHSGTTYFLAQMGLLHDMPEARKGAIKALSWLRRYRMRRCGPNYCVSAGGRTDVGSSALTTVAAAEILLGGEDPVAKDLVIRLTAFLRAQQREDGEIMHLYDRRRNEPIDVQLMYYSGETAFALIKAYRALGDERNLRAAERLMKHLTGEGWDFLGSHYYYGEEHWTCIAAGEARGLIDTRAALDFCQRWAGFGLAMQYDSHQTPWASEGAYGVGPFLLPRLTPVGSRSEAFISTYELAEHYGASTEELRQLVERGLGFLLRWRWAPGPTYALADPEGAYGAVPGTPVDLVVRNDYIQHAGSAWIRWADILSKENRGDDSN